MKKIILLIITFSLLLLCSCSNDTTSIYFEDAKYLIETIESTHPYFIINENLSSYDEQKTIFLEEVKNLTTEEEFSISIQKYLSVLKDAHTSLNIFDKSYGINADFLFEDSKLFLVNSNQVKNEIISLGESPITDVLKTIDTYVVSENDAAKRFNYELYSRNEQLLKLAGSQIKDNSINVKTSDGESLEYQFEYISWKNIKNPPHLASVDAYYLDDIYYINLSECKFTSNFYELLDELVHVLDSGTTKFIIDLQDNVGGDSEAGRMLINTLGFDVPKFGVISHYSQLSKLAEDTKSSGYYISERDVQIDKRNNNLQIAVLVSPTTFSSATMLAVWVQDAKIGSIIGEESTNSPSAYGNALNFNLPNTRLEMRVSSKYFVRPNKDNSSSTLEPDYYVDDSSNSLEFAIQYLNDL